MLGVMLAIGMVACGTKEPGETAQDTDGGTEVTDTDTPDTDTPDTDPADTDVPDTDVAETDVQDTDVPDTDIPDTDTDTDTGVVAPVVPTIEVTLFFSLAMNAALNPLVAWESGYVLIGDPTGSFMFASVRSPTGAWPTCTVQWKIDALALTGWEPTDWAAFDITAADLTLDADGCSPAAQWAGLPVADAFGAMTHQVSIGPVDPVVAADAGYAPNDVAGGHYASPDVPLVSTPFFAVVAYGIYKQKTGEWVWDWPLAIAPVDMPGGAGVVEGMYFMSSPYPLIGN